LSLDPNKEYEIVLMHIYSSPFLKILEKTSFKCRKIEEKEWFKIEIPKGRNDFFEIVDFIENEIEKNGHFGENGHVPIEFNVNLNTYGIELDIKKGFEVDFSTRFQFEICSLFGFEPGKYGEGHYETKKMIFQPNLFLLKTAWFQEMFFHFCKLEEESFITQRRYSFIQ